ncbi:MAG: acetate--CoA ligase family protein [Burkholderiaceae bacterium]|nr:acetate--CoA ligase family protein [Burkholderiaceae bacterium]
MTNFAHKEPTPSKRLSQVLNARSIAIVGASSDPMKVSGRPLAYMLARGFTGELYPVNPARQEVQGLRSYPSLASIDRPVDLAIIGTSASQVETAVLEGIAAGVKAFVIFSSGFAELDEEGRRLQERLSDLARSSSVTILGPNCLGIANSSSGLIASFTTALEETPLLKGGFSLVSQSGALGAYWLDIVLRSGLGFSQWITTGNECDIDAAQAIDCLVDEPETRVIGIYIEQVRDVPAFRRALHRAALAGKPVIAIKSGRSQAGAAAAASHTGALAGDDTLYDSCLRQHGAMRVESLSEMIDAARLFLYRSVPRGPRLAVMSVSGGAGVMIADAADALGMRLPAFEESTTRELRAVLPPFVHPSNPVDLTGNVVQDRSMISGALKSVAADPGIDAVVLFVGMMHSIAGAFIDALVDARKCIRIPIIVIWIGALDSTVDTLESAGLPVFLDIPVALRALSAAQHAVLFQEEARRAEVPGKSTFGVTRASRALTEWDGKQLLREQQAVQIPRGALITTNIQITNKFAVDFPVAAKLQAISLLHKSDAGAVVLRIKSREELDRAVTQLLDIGHTQQMEVQGVLVEQMIEFDHELLLGLRRDAQFGPVLTLARGGVQVELDADAVTRLLPLDARQIESMLRSLRSARLFDGFRGLPAVDLSAIAMRIAGLCDWFLRYEALHELEINPLALRGEQAWALDALMTLSE